MIHWRSLHRYRAAILPLFFLHILPVENFWRDWTDWGGGARGSVKELNVIKINWYM
jgi:hypothetical protein